MYLNKNINYLNNKNQIFIRNECISELRQLN
jgi:hypothetical protein